MDSDSDHVTDIEAHISDENNNNNKDDILHSDAMEDQITTPVAELGIHESITDEEEEREIQQQDEDVDSDQGNVQYDDQSEPEDSDQLQQLTNEYEEEEQEQESEVRDGGSYEFSGGMTQSNQAYEDFINDDVEGTASHHDDYQPPADEETTEETAEAFGQSEYGETAVRYENEAGQGELNETGMFSVLSANDTESESPASAVSPVSPASPVPVARIRTSISTPAAAPVQGNGKASGKFVMRSSRQQDANSFINLIRQAASTSDDSQSDERLTAIRETLSKLEDQKQIDRKTVVKEVFVKPYEKNVLSGATGPISPPVVTSYAYSASTKPTRRPTPAVVLNSGLKVAEPHSAAIEEEHAERTDEVVVKPVVNAVSAHSVSETNTSSASDLDAELNALKSPVSREPPTWLNDALEKQKRSADVIQTLEKTVSPQSANTPPPWVKDRIVKRSFTLPVTNTTAVPVAMAASQDQPSATAAETSSPANGVAKTEEPSPTQPSYPQWKADIETRKKLKSYIVSQKPEQPLRLGTVPDWKRQLSEKSKMKKGGEDGSPLSAGITSPDSPWRLELAQLKKQSVSSPDEEAQQVPEWLRLADEKQKAAAVSHEMNGVK